MFTTVLYLLAITGLVLSFFKDRSKTKKALQKALKSFLNILPDFALVLSLVGLMLTFISPSLISKLMGQESGFPGMLVASLAGSITLIPGFVAFPLAASLLNQGAGVTQMAVFISTLMMVGVVTFPMEVKFFSRRAALLRNGLSYGVSFVAALILGMVVAL